MGVGCWGLYENSITGEQAEEDFSMSEKAKFLDCTGASAPKLNLWPAVVISGEEIEAEIERLASLSPPASGRRASLIVHPYAEEPGLGLPPASGWRLTCSSPASRPSRSAITRLRSISVSVAAAERWCVANVLALRSTTCGTPRRWHHTGIATMDQISRCDSPTAMPRCWRR